MISGQFNAIAPTSPQAGGGVVMDDVEFERWVRLLEARTGVVVPPSRRQFLETNVRLRLQELGYRNLARYHDERLVGPNGAREWAILVDRLTVHETRFFRHPPSLAVVREVVLPAFHARTGGKGTFHAWSVGCATGEEAWSLAMIIDGYASSCAEPFRYGITGSDVSKPAMMVGQAGEYPLHRIKEVPEMYRGYCEQSAPDRFTISARLRERAGFAVLNLVDVDRQPMTQLELIYCQNVLIYFPRPRRKALLDELVGCLQPGGHLIIGPGEVTVWNNPLVERIANQRAQVYRRIAKDAES